MLYNLGLFKCNVTFGLSKRNQYKIELQILTKHQGELDVLKTTIDGNW